MSEQDETENYGPAGATVSGEDGGNVYQYSGRDRDAGASDEVMAAVGPSQIEANDEAAGVDTEVSDADDE